MDTSSETTSFSNYQSFDSILNFLGHTFPLHTHLFLSSFHISVFNNLIQCFPLPFLTHLELNAMEISDDVDNQSGHLSLVKNMDKEVAM